MRRWELVVLSINNIHDEFFKDGAERCQAPTHSFPKVRGGGGAGWGEEAYCDQGWLYSTPIPGTQQPSILGRRTTLLTVLWRRATRAKGQSKHHPVQKY